MSHRVVFYYDTVSPFAYLGFKTAQRYRKPWNLDLVSELRPLCGQ